MARCVVIRGFVALLLIAGITACDPVPPTQSAEPVPMELTAQPLASDRVNGVGRAVLATSDVVYLGGTFTSVRNQQGTTVAARSNLAAFDRHTGRLLTTFRADTNNVVRSLAYDGTNLYVSGSFTTVNGTSRARLAALDPVTGAVRAGWVAQVDSHVYSIDVAAGRVFLAGTFGAVNGVARRRVAAVSTANGAVDPQFNPNVNATVQSVAALADGSKAFIGGGYSTVAGVAATRLTALDGVTGRPTTPTFRDVSGQALALEVAPSGTHLAAALGDYGNQGAWFDLSTGRKLWRQRCGGDAQAVTVANRTMYTGFHEECEGNFDIRLVANDTANGSRDPAFMPAFDRFWGVWGLDGDVNGIVVAGDFTRVAGRPLQGLAIWPAATLPPPTTTTTTSTTTTTTTTPGPTTTTVPGATTTTTVPATTTTSPPTGPPVQVPAGSTWRYWDQGTTPAGWNQPGYDAGGWPSGPAQLGYGEGDQATTVSFGSSSTQKHLTTYFRTTFDAARAPTTLTLDLVADDGAVVYLNGVEVQRDNMPAGTVTVNTYAASGRSGADENAWRSFALPTALVQPGSNTLAIEIHQESRATSDMSFDAALRSS